MPFLISAHGVTRARQSFMVSEIALDLPNYCLQPAFLEIVSDGFATASRLFGFRKSI
jgi:hypothetical protein